MNKKDSICSFEIQSNTFQYHVTLKIESTWFDQHVSFEVKENLMKKLEVHTQQNKPYGKN